MVQRIASPSSSAGHAEESTTTAQLTDISGVKVKQIETKQNLSTIKSLNHKGHCKTGRGNLQNAERRMSVSGTLCKTCAFGFGRSVKHVNMAAIPIIEISGR